MMTDILFGQSYFLRFDPKLWEAMQPFPPLGTLYAAAVARDLGFRVALFDAMLADSTAEWTAALRKHQPRYAILYEDNFNYLSKMCLLNMRAAAFDMLAAARAQSCITIVCGADATDHTADYHAAGADYVLLGEGEETLADLLNALETGRPVHAIPGLAGNPSTVNHAPLTIDQPLPRPVIRNVDTLPFPAWDLVDVDHYRRIWLERHGRFAMNMVTTRGCPYHCNWCAKPIWGQRYNARSPQNVVAELAWLKQTYQPDSIWFVDDIMGLKPGWWGEFAALVEQQDARVPFKCLSRADLIVRDAQHLPAMRRAGCDIVWIGAESGAQSVLNAMEKGTTVEQIYTAAHLLHQAGIRVAFFLQFGYPGETRADIEKTLQMVRDCRPDDIGISVSYPLPGTKFYDDVRLQLGDKQNWSDSADLAMLYRGPFTTDFYRQLHTVVHKEYRARRAWHTLRATPVSQWRWPQLRDAAAGVYRMTTLPLARARLDRLAGQPHSGLAPMPHMSLAEASRPSPQDRDGA